MILMKRKCMAFFMTAILLIGLVGCGQSDSSNDSDSAEQNTVASTDDADADAAVKTTQSASEKKLSFDTTIEKTTLFDEQGIKIIANELKFEYNTPKLILTIKNDTDKKLSFISGSIGYSCNAVNHYMISSGYINEDVAPGKTVKTTATISADELQMLGITEIANIEIGLRVTDDDYNEYLTTGPLTIETSAADSYDSSADTYRDSIQNQWPDDVASLDYYSEELLFEESGISITSEALATNKEGKKAVFIEMENSNSDLVYASVSDISVNGIVIQSPTWTGETINPDCRCVMNLTIDDMLNSSSLEELGIDDIATVEFSMKAEDSNHNVLANAEEVTIKVKDGGSADNGGKEIYNENGIRISSKQITKDEFDNMHILLMVENNYTEKLDVDVAYDSLSINDIMIDFLTYGADVAVGKSAVVDVEITESTLEENDIADITDVSAAEMTLEIRDDHYNDIAKPSVVISY